MRVISATFAPLPPSRSRISREPSEKSYTNFVPVATSVKAAPRISLRHAPQTYVRVVLQGLRYRPVGLSQCRIRGARSLSERPAQGVDQEAVGLLSERERV